MTETTGELLCGLHDELVRTITATPGVSRLVPSYRELLTRSARALFSGSEQEPSGIDIVKRPGGTTIYIDFYVMVGYHTGAVVDDVHDAAQRTVQARRNSQLPPQVHPQADDVTFKIRVLGIE